MIIKGRTYQTALYIFNDLNVQNFVAIKLLRLYIGVSLEG